MTYEVYVLRERGSAEIRYVGQTAHGAIARLRFLTTLARSGIGDQPMREWMVGCNFDAEAVTVAEFETREEAKAFERTAISMFHAVGHRLLNKQFLPKAPARDAIAVARKMVKAA